METPQTRRLFDMAIQHHQAGRLAEARDGYERILALEPAHADSLHLLGVVTHQSREDGERALALVRRAIALSPGAPEYHCNLGLIFSDLRRWQEAIASFRQALALRPQYPTALNYLGNALRATGQLEDAAASYRQAVAAKPDFHVAFSNLGNVLRELNRPTESADACRRAIAIKPDFAPAHNNLGNALNKLDRLDEAVEEYRRALALDPRYAEARSNLGSALKDLGRLDEAVAAYREALAVNPNLPECHGNLIYLDRGVALGKSGDLAGAAANLRKAIELDPNCAKAHFNLGVALGDLHEIDGAIAAYRHAIELREDYAEARHALAMVHLQRGCFEQGWPDYEYRWKLPSGPKPYRHRQPRWSGESLQGKTILLYVEQGLGDTLQFARYIPLVAARAAHVYLIAKPELERLFSQWPKVQLLTDLAQRLPEYDLHCALTSLPLAFGTRLESIPAEVPYLAADPALALTWEKRFEGTRRPRVGLVWAGNPQHQNDKQRSISLSRLAPLSRFAGQAAFFSLQKGDPARQRWDVPELNIVDLASELNDFADTAAVISCLDLVISVDTAVAHLAGAMGKPTWTLLAFASDWRWLLDRADSPWYPTMRLFRQRAAGDWEGPVAQIVAQMEELPC